MATVWMFGQVGQSLTGETDSFRVYAMLDDVSGLVTKSRVSIAGINVGQLDEVELVEGRARVWVRIAKRPDFVLKSDARIHKRQASLLGEYYRNYTRLPRRRPQGWRRDQECGHRCFTCRTDERSSQNFTRRGVNYAKCEAVVGADGGEQKLIQIVDEFHKTASAIEQTVTRNSEKFDVILDNVVATTQTARHFSEDFRSDARIILDDAKSVTKTVRQIVGSNSQTVEEGFDGMKGAIGRLQSALAKLEDTLESTRSIGKKIDKGDGTLGQLVNDGSLARNLNDFIQESNQVVRQFTRLQTIVGMSSEVYADRGAVRNALEVRLQPRADKYYALELVDDPRGLTRTTETVTNSSSSERSDHSGATVGDRRQISFLPTVCEAFFIDHRASRYHRKFRRARTRFALV